MTDTKDMPEPVAWRWTFNTWGGWFYGGKMLALGEPDMAEPIYSSATVTALMERVEKAETAERERDLYLAALQDEERPMESDSDEMTAAESVLAYLYVEIVGAPDDEAVSPLKAQKAIEAKLSSAEAERDAAIARAERAERLLAEARKALEPFASFAEKAERFIQARSEQGGSPIMPTRELRLAHFRAARAIVNKEGGE